MNKNIDIEYESMQETIDEGQEIISELKEENRKLNDEIIDLSADLGMYQNENESLTKDIEKYWQLEQKLGCPLEVVVKALKDGIDYEVEITSYLVNDIETETKYKEKRKNITSADIQFVFSRRYNQYILRVPYDITRNGFKWDNIFLKDYKRTWWLKGEKDVNL